MACVVSPVAMFMMTSIKRKLTLHPNQVVHSSVEIRIQQLDMAYYKLLKYEFRSSAGTYKPLKRLELQNTWNMRDQKSTLLVQHPKQKPTRLLVYLSSIVLFTIFFLHFRLAQSSPHLPFLLRGEYQETSLYY